MSMDGKELAEFRLKILELALGLADKEYEDTMARAAATQAPKMPKDNREWRATNIAKKWELNYLNPESGQEWFEKEGNDVKKKPDNSNGQFLKKPVKIKT